MRKLVFFISLFCSYNLLIGQWRPFYDGGNFADGIIYGNEVFLSSPEDGIVYSTNLGDTWEFRNNDFTGQYPSLYSMIYSNNYLVANIYNSDDYKSGILVSSDKGISWTKSNYFSTNGGLLQINYFLKHKDNLFAIHNILEKRIMRSTDNGLTWDTCALPQNKLSIYHTLNVFSTEKYLFASVDSAYDSFKSKGFFRSDDFGKTWEKIYDLNYDYMVSIGDTIIPVRYKTVRYKTDSTGWEFYISTDNGNTWNYRQLMKNAISIYDYVYYKEKLFVLYEMGILVSSDYGYTWENFVRFSDFSVKNHGKLTIDGNNVYITDNIALYVSSDIGKTWTRKNWGMSTRDYKYLDIWGDDFYIFHGKYGNTIYKSTNFGKTWSNLKLYYGASSYINDCVEYNENILLGTTPGVLYYSTVKQSFEPTNLMGTSSMQLRLFFNNKRLFATSPFRPSDMYQNVYGIYKSDGNGMSWTRKAPYLPNNFKSLKSSYPLSIGNKVYINYNLDSNYTWNTSYFYSYNTDTDEWQLLDTSGIFINARTRGIYKNNLLAAQADGKVYKSSDGINWELFFEHDKLPDSFIESGGNLFFNAFRNGIYYSNDEGKSWKNITLNLRWPYVLELNVFKGYLFANTTTWGIYYAKLSDLGITSVEEQNTPKSDKCFIFPNPATDNITLDAQNLEPMREIVIYDVFGNNVLTIETQRIVSLQKIDVSTLPPGVYFLKVGNEKPMKFTIVR